MASARLTRAALIVVVVVSGALLGIVNTVLTEAVMAAAVVERPVASAAYSFVRFTGGAIAPFLAGKLAEHVSAGAPMYVGGGMVCCRSSRSICHATTCATAKRSRVASPGRTSAPMLVAIDGGPDSGA